jgi:uncharacterized NAD(P)/FAD-binding protein YdhS
VAGKPERFAIVGGGYTGALLAVQLARAAPRALDITVIEPRPELGRGLAHSTRHPDHRLNAPAAIHNIFPDEPDAFANWLDETGVTANDPESRARDGAIYPRRHAFGDYIGAIVDGHAMLNPSGSHIRHERDAAVAIHKKGSTLEVALHRGNPIPADIVALATSNERPSRPGPFQKLRHEAFFANPWQIDYPAIAGEGHVLVVGTGLTAVDIIAALLRTGHGGPITAVSRRGLAPTRRWSDGTPGPAIWDALARDVPAFVERHGTPERIVPLLRTLRADIRERYAAGSSWQPVFDELRDAALVLWPNLPVTEKRRFMRHLRSWYEAHRFRMPPPLEPIFDGAIAAGQLTVGQGFLQAARPSPKNAGKSLDVMLVGHDGTRKVGTYAAVINCTGPEQHAGRSSNPVIRDLMRQGMARPHPCGMGLLVDERCRVIGHDSLPQTDHYAFGLLTRGTFGESTSVPHIAWQIANAVGEMVGD